MQHQMMGYDRAATMFSPDGHILQVEYAEKTVRLGSASIGFVTDEGVVIIADKRINDKLMVESSANKVFEVDMHIMGCAAGILSDARVLVERAQLIAQQHRVTYDTPIDVLSIIKDLSSIKQQYTQHPGARPFGVSVMIAGIDDKPSLYISDITGNYVEYHSIAIGENDDKIKEKLREKYKRFETNDEAIKLGLSIFQEIKGKDFDINKMDVGVIDSKKKKIKRLDVEDLKKHIK